MTTRGALLAAAVALAAGGCEFAWDDLPYAKLHPVSASVHVTDAQWRAEVAAAAWKWNEGLVALGCEPPFQETMATTPGAGHRVTIVDEENWEHPGLDGITTGDFPTEPRGTIEVLYPSHARPHHQSVLVHELGHAIGLDHARAGELSVMVTDASIPSHPLPKDFLDAAELLGCAP